MPGLGEPAHDLERPGERARPRVVVREPEGAVPLEERLDVLRGAHERAQLRAERGPDARDPLRVRRAAAVALEGLAHRLEDERDGVHEGAVEIEQDGHRTGRSQGDRDDNAKFPPCIRPRVANFPAA